MTVDTKRMREIIGKGWELQSWDVDELLKTVEHYQGLFGEDPSCPSCGGNPDAVIRIQRQEIAKLSKRALEAEAQRDMLRESCKTLEKRVDWADRLQSRVLSLEAQFAALAIKETEVPLEDVAKVGDVYAFEYEDVHFNRTLTVVEVKGFGLDDLVFFEDRSHSKQKHLLSVKRVGRV
jgi:hypothetical protein